MNRWKRDRTGPWGVGGRVLTVASAVAGSGVLFGGLCVCRQDLDSPDSGRYELALSSVWPPDCPDDVDNLDDGTVIELALRRTRGYSYEGEFSMMLDGEPFLVQMRGSFDRQFKTVILDSNSSLDPRGCDGTMRIALDFTSDSDNRLEGNLFRQLNAIQPCAWIRAACEDVLRLRGRRIGPLLDAGARD